MDQEEPARELDDILRIPIPDEERASSRPPAIPTVGQRRIVAEVIDEARKHLKLPDRIHIRFVSGKGGTTGRREDGELVIWLGLGVWPDQLRGTAFHEVQHCADLHSGEWNRLAPVQRERRAIDFSNRMMRGITVR